MTIPFPTSFRARTQTGSSRGRELGYPTVNLHLDDVPLDLEEGIYAGFAETDGKRFLAAIHYGPRPAFRSGPAFEVHLLDVTLPALPAALDVTIMARIRDVLDFPTPQALSEQIAKDVDETRRLLGSAS